MLDDTIQARRAHRTRARRREESVLPIPGNCGPDSTSGRLSGAMPITTVMYSAHFAKAAAMRFCRASVSATHERPA